MISGETPAMSFVSRLLDPLIVVGTLIVLVFAFGVPLTGQYMVLAVLSFFLAGQIFGEFDLAHTMPRRKFLAQGGSILMGWFVLACILLLLGYATKLSSDFSRRVLLSWFVLAPVAIFSGHMIARKLVYLGRLGVDVRNVVIVGAGDLGLKLAQKIRQDPYLFMKFQGFFDDRHLDRVSLEARGDVVGKLDDLATFWREKRIHAIYITLPISEEPRVKQLLETLQDTTASIYFVPDIFMFDLVQARLDQVAGIPVLAVRETPFMGVNAVLKRASDVVLSLVILTLIAPILLAIAVTIKIRSPGPVIFKQRRYGLDGEEITVYKFRSMTVAEDGADVAQAKRGDQRVTPLGAFLRKTSLDELPQFLNVLVGSMSIVGPRPHAVAHNEMYRKLIKGYMVRHKVKPGITGWAQVNGLRGETDTLDKMEARVKYDIDYLRNWSLSLDIMIILQTVLVVFRDRNAY